MKVLLGLVFLALASATSFKSQFEAFEHEFGKKYTNSAERLTRFATFMKNVKEIEEHNNSGKYGYKKVINKFADMTQVGFIYTFWISLSQTSSNLGWLEYVRHYNPGFHSVVVVTTESQYIGFELVDL